MLFFHLGLRDGLGHWLGEIITTKCRQSLNLMLEGQRTSLQSRAVFLQVAGCFCQPHLLLDACGLSQMRPLQPNTDLGQLLLEYSGDEGQVCADADDDACDDFDDEPGASMLPRELRSSNLTQCGDAVDIIAPAEQQAHSAPLAAPQLSSCASSGRAWRSSGQLGTPRKRPGHWARGHWL